MSARLPSEADLGPLVSPQSSRSIASIDTTGYAKGAAALAEGTKDLGKGIFSASKDVLLAYNYEQAQASKFDDAKATSAFCSTAW